MYMYIYIYEKYEASFLNSMKEYEASFLNSADSVKSISAEE